MALSRTNETLPLECFGLGAAAEVIYALSGERPSRDDDKTAATELCRLLGGLPLAMGQVATFITDRGCLFSEFLPLFQKLAEKVFARSRALDEYGHTVTTVWNISLEQLDTTSRS